ncbi:MAG TPA: FtsX-like permease family protein [Candidatus Alectryocaccomicrobium excrementavium]|uniref:FtsX-like permease family protein n=1 Tax=Candidatus Alectryocaccomicrobium excrementavium TaxID=2840668 RepID=A0A9D1K6R5_9FIRM|nr:FtsX-like permease family protein [Candidatus Alectryocaccomicrobium excrementavium]
MIRFVLRKMLSKKWMVLALLVGNILLISITAGNPMYTRAVLQRTLTRNLETYLVENNAYPGLVTFRTSSSSKDGALLRQYEQGARETSERFGVDAVETADVLYLTSAENELLVPREDAEDKNISIGMMTDLPEHSELVAGEFYSSDEPGEDGVIDAVLSERALMELNLLLGDEVSFPEVLDPSGNPIRIRIAGVFRNRSSDDIFWVRTPSSYQDVCFISPALFESYFLQGDELEYGVNASYYVLLDYTAMRGDQAQQILSVADAYRAEFNGRTIQNYRDNFSTVLTDYLEIAKKVNVTLWVLQTPIFALLAAFIFMVSRQMLEMEQNEIAVIKSRGAGRGQIFTIYLLESLILSVIAFAIGVPLGAYICQVIGSANAFLEFVRRSALPVEIHADALLFAVAASLLSIVAMVLPAVRYAKTSIVGHKQRKNRRSSTPMWQKLGLDFLLLAVSLYGLYTFNNQRGILAQRVLEGASLDPLLFVSSSLFMIGAGLLMVRVLPAVVWLIFSLFKRLWSPALYASFLRVLRTRSSQGFIMVFLIMTIALGVFNAQAARTINQNMEDNLRYTIGADVVLQESWENNGMQVAEDPSLELLYEEPDYGRYTALKGHGIEALAQVYVNRSATMSVSGGTLRDVQVMGIHTKDFGETAWFKDSLSDIHWYNYLNAISQNSRAVLLSRNFQTEYGYELGDTINYRNSSGDSVRGIVYGFVDYFPGYVPVTYSLGSDGLYQEKQTYLIVAHLAQLQASWGVAPYQIWIKNEDGSSYIYDFAEENGLSYTVFRDSDAELVERKNDPVLQGTNGILTVGFIVVLLLCCVGFLIYWILSIQSRALQFGIFRAMGMSMREVISMLLNEQLFISGLSIAVGALVGHLTARLYMPLIQLAYAASDNALPLEVVRYAADDIRLFSVVGGMMLLCMVILGVLISRMKIAQALKLGED